MLDEAVDVIRALFEDDSIDHAGGHFAVGNARRGATARLLRHGPRRGDRPGSRIGGKHQLPFIDWVEKTLLPALRDR